MSELPTLRAIRHMAHDAFMEIARSTPSTEVGPSLQRTYATWSEFVKAEYKTDPDTGYETNEIVKVECWPQLKPLERLIYRLDTYIKDLEGRQ